MRVTPVSGSTITTCLKSAARERHQPPRASTQPAPRRRHAVKTAAAKLKGTESAVESLNAEAEDSRGEQDGRAHATLAQCVSFPQDNAQVARKPKRVRAPRKTTRLRASARKVACEGKVVCDGKVACEGKVVCEGTAVDGLQAKKGRGKSRAESAAETDCEVSGQVAGEGAGKSKGGRNTKSRARAKRRVITRDSDVGSATSEGAGGPTHAASRRKQKRARKATTAMASTEGAAAAESRVNGMQHECTPEQLNEFVQARLAELRHEQQNASVLYDHIRDMEVRASLMTARHLISKRRALEQEARALREQAQMVECGQPVHDFCCDVAVLYRTLSALAPAVCAAAASVLDTAVAPTTATAQEPPTTLAAGGIGGGGVDGDDDDEDVFGACSDSDDDDVLAACLSSKQSFCAQLSANLVTTTAARTAAPSGASNSQTSMCMPVATTTANSPGAGVSGADCSGAQVQGIVPLAGNGREALQLKQVGGAAPPTQGGGGQGEGTGGGGGKGGGGGEVLSMEESVTRDQVPVLVMADSIDDMAQQRQREVTKPVVRVLTHGRASMSTVVDVFLEKHGTVPKPLCTISDETCSVCSTGRLVLDVTTDMLVCEHCRNEQECTQASDRSAGYSGAQAMHYSACRYNRQTHYATHLDRACGCVGSDKITPKLLNRVMQRMLDDGVTQVNVRHVERALKALDLSKLCSHKVVITARITGIPPPAFSPPERCMLLEMFIHINAAFIKLRRANQLEGRLNYLSYPYTIFKCVEMLTWGQKYLLYFNVLRCEDNRAKQDRCWEKICTEVGLPFIRCELKAK